jgi:hypothetical protein
MKFGNAGPGFQFLAGSDGLRAISQSSTLPCDSSVPRTAFDGHLTSRGIRSATRDQALENTMKGDNSPGFRSDLNHGVGLV